MKITLKNVQVNQKLSDETLCFSATLYIDGTRAGVVSNRGCGAPHEFQFQDRKLEKSFYEWCQQQPPHPADASFPYSLPMDADLYISLLLGDMETNKQIKKWCKKQTLFRLKNDPKGEWRTLKLPFNQQVKERIIAKYGDQIAEIANERI
jgi:hypothetical protein